jgi:thioredoxin reductase (NADPH)
VGCLDLIIVGAGPAGLSAAIAAKRAGLDAKVFEKGVLVNSLFHFPSQMVFFTTPELLEVGGLPFSTPHEKPTRDEALRYYRKVVDACELSIDFGQTVHSVCREPLGGEGKPDDDATFRVVTSDGQGREQLWETRTIVLSTGCYDRPNRLGIPGEDLPHVSHYYTEPHEFFRKHVVIVGGKNSAAEAALDLYRTGARVTLVHRRAELGASLKYWVRPDIENRIKEGSIVARFNSCVTEIRPTEGVVECEGARETLSADAVFLLTGYVADLEFLKDCGIQVDPGTNIPTHNPETFETNVPGLYLAGAVVAGANRGEVFIENGRFHGAVVVAEVSKRLRRPLAERASQ